MYRFPRKLKEGKTFDTIIFDCNLNNAKEIEELIPRLNPGGRILLVVPIEREGIEFPEEAGRVWGEVVLREVVSYVIKFNPVLKQKLFYLPAVQVNEGYSFAYVALESTKDELNS